MRHIVPALIQAVFFAASGGLLMAVGHDGPLWLDAGLVAFIVRLGAPWS